MHQRPDLTTARAVLTSWLAAAFAAPAALLASAAGQGLGTLAAGGGWIGVCVAWDREVWALVNQPTINFAASWAGTGYWLGSWLLPLVFAAAIMPLSIRIESLGSQLVIIQTAWAALVIGASWQTFLDVDDGHLARWLAFRNLPTELRWVVVVVGVAAAIPIVMRLLALARITRYRLSRSRRLGLVMLHLLPAPIGWAVVTSSVRDTLPIEACIAAGLPLLTAVVVAWIGYPAPPTHAVLAPGGWALAVLLFATAVAWASIVVAGRPLPAGRTAAIQWARENATNNIRAWMEPRLAPWVTTDAVEDS